MIPAKHSDKPKASRERRTAALTVRSFLSYTAALLLAITLSGVASTLSDTGRLSNVDLSQDGFAKTYLMFSKTEPGFGYLVNRRDSTIRRSRRKVGGDRWQLTPFASDEAGKEQKHWLLRSESQQTVFLVSVSSVTDWNYPFAYSFVARECNELELPAVEWTQLYVNRVYHGLYLRVELPHDLRKKDGGNGVRREVCSVQGSEMTVVDTSFHAETRLYADCIANGVFPQLAKPSSALRWLDDQRPTAEQIFLLDNKEPFGLSLLPLPISLQQLYELVYGTGLRPITDERYQRWVASQQVLHTTRSEVFDSETYVRFEREFEEYKKTFEAALKVHQTVLALPVAGSVQQGQRNVGVLAE